MLAWMRDQAQVTNRWAAEDRSRDINTFRPLQDQFIAEAQTWDSPERKAQQAAAATADVNIAARGQMGAMNREAASMGINPASGRFASAQAKMGTDVALAGAGAANLARRQVSAEGDARRAQAINLGSGFAVNPGSAMGISNSAGQSGFSGAMQGYGQQAGILNQDFQNRMQAHQSRQSGLGGLFGGLGSIIGAGMGPGGFLAGLSSKDYKTDKAPSKGHLEAVEKMPVEEWTYKKGIADEGRHVGPYAEDFKAATGKGDGKTIPVMDMMGVTLGAVQELGAKVKKLEAKMTRGGTGTGAKTPARSAPPSGMGAMRRAA
jgi:hypothetical protein